MRRRRRQRVGPGRGTVGIDAGALLRRIILGDQRRNRGADKGGIAEIARPVGIGALHGLDHHMQRRDRALLHVLHRKALEDVQGLQQHDAAGRWLRHRDNVIAAIAAADRRPDDGLIRFQVVRRHDAAGVADRLHELGRDRTLVKSAWTLFGDRCQRRGEVGLDQPVAFAQRRAVRAGKDLLRCGPARQSRVPVRQRIGAVVGDDNSVAREIDGRSQDFRQREFAGAVFFQRQRQSRDGAGHADGERGIARLRGIGLAVGPEEHPGVVAAGAVSR